MLIIGGSGPGKTNITFHLMNQHPDIDKSYLYTKDQLKQNINFQKTRKCELKTFEWF